MADNKGLFRSVEQQKAAMLVVRQIEELILTGVYRPGDRLPAERALEKKLDVSRPTLREAIRNLEERGLVIIRQGDGTRIADVTGSMFGEPIIELFRANSRATRDYLEFRREIEAIAAGYAARRATPADREIILHFFNRLEDAHEARKTKAVNGRDETAREAENDIGFHAAIGEASHNIVLIHTLRSCYQLLRNDVFCNRNLLYNLAGRRELLLEQHRAICEAVLSGNVKAAEQAAADHIQYVEDAMLDASQYKRRQSTSAQRLEKLKQTVGKV